MKKILLPTDFSEPAGQAARYGVALAAVLGAEVTLLHVEYEPVVDAGLPAFPWGVPSGRDPVAVQPRPDTQLRTQLAQHAERLRLESGGIVPIRTLLVQGVPEEEITTVAQRTGCDLIITATRGHGPLFNAFFGSVTAGLIEDAAVPVLVIPEGAVFRGIRHVLYASDFDPADGPVIRHMIRLLGPLDFDLCSVYIFNDGGRTYEREDYDGLRDALSHHLRGVAMTGTLQVDAHGSRDLLAGLDRAMRDNRVDLLVMTTHRRNLLTRFTHPSLTKRMLAHTQTPLLVFCAPEAEG